jgi:hypothetical protein
MALAALAGPRTVVVAAGDCRDASLLAATRDFVSAAAGPLGSDLLEAEVVLDIVRPRPARSLQDIERQVESAKALLYSGQDTRGLEVISRALVDLDTLPPSPATWPVKRAALVLQALMHKNLEHPKEMAESFRLIARVEPGFELDRDAHAPSALAAWDAARKDIARTRKARLDVRLTGGPPGAVYVDGVPMGSTPLKLELVPGTYRVAIASGKAFSFPRRVELPRDTSLVVDLLFEAALALQPPLCLQATDDSSALKLAQLATAERAVVMRNLGGGAAPAYVSGALYDVVGGRQERVGTVQPGHVAKLATFLLTGREQPGVQRASPPAAASATETAARGEPRTDAAADAPVRARPPASTLTVDSSPSVAAPPHAATAARGASRARSVPGQVLSGVLAGVGVVAIVSGAVAYDSAAPSRKRLAGLTGVDGTLPTAGTTAHREALDLMQMMATNRAIAFGLIGAGVGAVVTGGLGVWLFAGSSTTVDVAASAEGAAVSISGRF